MKNERKQLMKPKNDDFKILAYVHVNNKQSLKILKNKNFKINNKKRNKIEMIYEK